MKITYFKGTDTLLLTFNDNKVERTQDLSQNVLVDLDKSGNVVAMTVEHAAQQTQIANFSFNQIAA